MIIYNYESKKLYIPDGIGNDCGCGGECTPEQLNKAYQSGYTNGTEIGYADGYDKGLDDGAEQQKALLIETAITENGVYTREDGYSSISVNVPQTGHTDEELQQAFISGETHQKSLLISSAFTENGDYSREDGYSSINVNVPQTGHTDEELDEAWDNGYRVGFNDGADSVVCSGYTQEDLNAAFASGWSAGYVSGYTDGGGTNYLTIEIVSGGSLYWYCQSVETGDTKQIDYKLNNSDWATLQSSHSGSGTPITNTTLNAGDVIKFRGYNSGYCTGLKYNGFKGDAVFRVSGNILSLITGFTEPHTFCSLFMDCTGLIDASNLVLPVTTTNFCYDAMFGNCTSLTGVPELPATTLAEGCYRNMFYGCTSLTTAPELPATTLASYCYFRMFEGCISLNYIKCLATNISASSCTNYWVSGVAASGTFVKAAGTDWSTKTGTNGIPSGWTVEEE